MNKINIIGINGDIGAGKDTVGNIIQFLVSREKGYLNLFDTNTAYLYWKDDITPNTMYQNWEIKKFAYKLKQIASILTGIPVEKFEDQEFKKSAMSKEWYKTDRNTKGELSYVLSYRAFLQKLGTEAIRDNIHPETWVNALFADYNPINVNHEYRDSSDNRHTIQVFNNPVFGDKPVYPNWIITDTRFPNEAKAIKDRNGIVIRVNRYVNNPLDEAHGLSMGDFKRLSNNTHSSETALDDYLFDYIIINSGTIEELILEVKQMLQHFKII